MRHVTGPAKWLHLGRALFKAVRHPLPIGFEMLFLKHLSQEKLTLLDGRTYIKGNYPTLESRAFGYAAESLSRIGRGEQRLLTITICPTMRCPMKCSYCSGRNFPPGPELGTARLRRLVTEAQDLGAFAVDFSGGEPLLRTDLPEIVSAVDDRSLALLFTSGLRFPPAARALRQAGLEHVVISLDTFDEAAFNRRRGSKQALAIALEAARASVREGFYTMFEMTADEAILRPGAFEAFLREAGRLGVHEVRTLAPRACVALGGSRSRGFSPAQARALRCHQMHYNRMADLPSVTSIDYIESADNQGCFGGTGFCHVTAEGDVAPCPFHPISFGNIADRPLAEVYRTMRRYIPWPPATCPIVEIFDLIGERPEGPWPVRDAETIERVYERYNRKAQPIPEFWRRLGIRRSSAAAGQGVVAPMPVKES
jgi:MoaA/NifB/PqqE/SkfB family radical SAM enzyme